MLDNGKQDSDVQEIFAPEGRAALAIAEGRPAAAIAAMQPTLPYELSDPTVSGMRGAAYLAANQGEAAQKEFMVLIDRPFISAISPNVPTAHVQLARALVLQGNKDAARREYETFFLHLEERRSRPALITPGPRGISTSQVTLPQTRAIATLSLKRDRLRKHVLLAGHSCVGSWRCGAAP